VAVTAGYVCEKPRAEFYRYIDAANVDLKAFTEEFYRDVCGGSLAPVLETLTYLKEKTGVWVELTTLLIPGLNDSEAEISAMTKWVVGNLGPAVPMHFSAFHPDWKMRDRSATPRETLRRARQIAIQNGVRYAYTGNVHDEEGDATYCHACGERVIGRDWYVLTAWDLNGMGCCVRCGERCAGRFDSTPGDWGARRLPIRLADFA
jgi:pyruvate formate lyase activating enzyme